LTRFSRTVEFIPRHADYQQPDNPQKSAKKSEFGGLFSSDNPPKSMKKSEFGGLFGRFIKRICISKLLYLNEKQLRIILVEVV
jgi:hypothetical protein